MTNLNIGSGIVFPIQLVDGKPPITKGADLITSNLHDIFTTVLGSRILMGHYGSRISELIEEPTDTVAQNLIEHFIRDAVAMWETRIELISSEITLAPIGKFKIKATYKIKNQTGLFTFVYPNNL